MKHLALLMISGLYLLLSACGVPALNPLHDANTVTAHDSTLVGAWVEKGAKAEDVEKSTVVIREAVKEDGDGAAGGYIVTLKNSEGKPFEFQAHLVTLGARTFASITPTEKARKKALDGHYGTMIPTYQIARLKIGEGTLTAAFLDPAALRKILTANPGALRHAVQSNNDLLVLAPSKELAAFVKAHAEDAELFAEGSEYVKK